MGRLFHFSWSVLAVSRTRPRLTCRAPPPIIRKTTRIQSTQRMTKFCIRRSAGTLSGLGTAIFCLFLLVSVAPPGLSAGPRPADERITVNVNNKPLGEVLTSISRSTGYAFELEDSWRQHPVTAQLEDIPLHAGLKRLLDGLNHAIVYLPDGRIKIMIYEASTGGSAPNAQPPTEPAIERPASRTPRPPARSFSPTSPSRRAPAGTAAGTPEPEEAEPDPGQPGEEDSQD